jgi:hypothetical protein
MPVMAAKYGTPPRSKPRHCIGMKLSCGRSFVQAVKGEARPSHVLTFREFVATSMNNFDARVSAKMATDFGARRRLVAHTPSAGSV